MLKILHGDYRRFMNPDAPLLGRVDTIFADPPDNIGLEYDEYEDSIPYEDYWNFLYQLVSNCYLMADTTYISFNARWMTDMGDVLSTWRRRGLFNNENIRWLIQGFTFGEHRKTDYANNFRPIVRLRRPEAKLYPDQTRIESDRMKQGDKRANPAGRVPGDVWRSDFLEYSRVVGNSKQRRSWHKTQLNEGLVEDCLLMSTPPGGTVIDPFCGTGTTLRVCKANGWSCTTMDVSLNYCEKVAEEHEIPKVSDGIWCV